MPIFEFKAVTPEGQTITGVEHGASIESVAQVLQQRGLQVQSLSAASDDLPTPEQSRSAASASNRPPRAKGAIPGADERSFFEQHFAAPLVGGVPLVNLDFFFRQMSALLNAGINPSAACETLAKQTQNPKLRVILLECADLSSEGLPFSAGLERYPEVFSPMMISMVKVAEEGGFLSRQCQLISEYLAHEVEIRTLIRRETFYPKAVLASSIFIILLTNGIIASMGKQGGISSPLTTVTTWFCLAPLIIGIFLFVKVGLPQPHIQHRWQRFLLSLPWFKDMIRGFAMVKFARAFAALYRSGVPLPKAMKLSADACGNVVVRDQIYPAVQPIEGGSSVTESMARTGAFPPVVLDMVRTGEMTGNMDDMLDKCAEYFEDEGKTKAKQAAISFGVLVFLAVGIYVAYVVITFYMKYFGGITGGI